MKKVTMTAAVISLTLVCAWRGAAQEVPHRKLERIRAKIEKSLQKKLPDWRRISITPMEGSKNVIIDHWESGEWAIKVAILHHKSPAEASDALKSFRKRFAVEEEATKKRGRKDFRIAKEDLPLLGDGGFTWETYGSTATAFCKGELTVYVSVVRPVLTNDEVMSKRLAHHIADIFSGPDEEGDGKN